MNDMKKLTIYLEVDDMAIDEAGNKCPAGLSISFGEIPAEKLPPYEELTKDLKPEDFNGLPIFRSMDTTKLHIITPERYEELYGDEEK